MRARWACRSATMRTNRSARRSPRTSAAARDAPSTAVQTTTSSITAPAVGFRTTHSDASEPPGALRTSRARNGPTACSRVSVAGVQRWRRHRGVGVSGGGGSPGTPSARSVTVKSGLMAYWKRCASSQKPGAASHSGNGGAQTSPSPAPRYHLSSRGTRLFLKRRDLAQQLRVVAPVSQLRFDVPPADPPGSIDEEIRPLGEELILDQHIIGAGHRALEVGQEIHLHPVLGLELPQGGHRVHADGKHDRAGAREPVEILAERAQLGSARRGEGQREEREQRVRPAAQARERHVEPGRGRQGEVGRQVTDLRRDRGGGRRHDATISRIRWDAVRNSGRTNRVARVMSQGGTRRGNPSRPSGFEFAATAVHLTSVPDCRRRRTMPGAVTSTEKVVAHTLPKLPYEYGALEPHIDRQTMEIHHTKHHQAYINNLNAALDKHPELRKKTLEELLRGINSVPEDIRPAVRNNAGGHHNHSLFWTIMGPKAGGEPSGTLADAIKKTFGDFAKFKEQIAAAGTGR